MVDNMVKLDGSKCYSCISETRDDHGYVGCMGCQGGVAPLTGELVVLFGVVRPYLVPTWHSTLTFGSK